jgi:hypothetical protein
MKWEMGSCVGHMESKVNYYNWLLGEILRRQSEGIFCTD